MEKKLFTIYVCDNKVRNIYHVSATEEEVAKTVDELNKGNTLTFRYVPLAITTLEDIENTWR